MVDELFSLKQQQSKVNHEVPAKPYNVSQISRATQTGSCLGWYVQRILLASGRETIIQVIVQIIMS